MISFRWMTALRLAFRASMRAIATIDELKRRDLIPTHKTRRLLGRIQARQLVVVHAPF